MENVSNVSSGNLETNVTNLTSVICLFVCQLRSITGIGETLEKVSVSTTFAQSRSVSVSTTPNFLVSKNLSLDNLQILGLKMSQSRQISILIFR